jgi:hypothetical protein
MPIYQRTFWLVIFSMAMGYLEASVVVYLRELYYPNGFAFPLVVLRPEVGLVEIFREAATVIMLLALGILVGQNLRQRFAYFLIAFATWDIFYYVFLKLILGWPTSVFTWDILFLIPVPWVGPVLSPLIICITMFALAGIILRNEQREQPEGLTGVNWALILGGSLTVVMAWMWDYIALSGGLPLSPEAAMEVLSAHVPDHFNWWIFGAGEAMILSGIARYGKTPVRMVKSARQAV